MTASAESVVMKVEMLAMEALNLFSLTGYGKVKPSPSMISFASELTELVVCHDSRIGRSSSKSFYQRSKIRSEKWAYWVSRAWRYRYLQVTQRFDNPYLLSSRLLRLSAFAQSGRRGIPLKTSKASHVPRAKLPTQNLAAHSSVVGCGRKQKEHRLRWLGSLNPSIRHQSSYRNEWWTRNQMKRQTEDDDVVCK